MESFICVDVGICESHNAELGCIGDKCGYYGKCKYCSNTECIKNCRTANFTQEIEK